MDRRNALKKIGLSLGYVAAVPTALSILESCINESKLLWNPKFFTKKEAIIVENLIDLILPTTKQSLGAIDVNVHLFLDSYFDKVVEIDGQNSFKKGIQLILNTFGNDVDNITVKQYDALLTKYLKSSLDNRELFKNNEDTYLIYQTLTVLRSKSVWAFKTSQEIGKNVLAYDPVPGVQIGCMPLNEATGGKGWSLMN